MWHSIRTNLPLSFRPNMIAALPAAVLTTVLSAWTVDGSGNYGGYFIIALLHFVCAYVLLELLWLPLTWCRKQLIYPRYALTLALMLTLLLTAALCAIFPYELFLKFLAAKTSSFVLMAGVFFFHAAGVFIFLRNLRNLRLDLAAVVKGHQPRRLVKRALRQMQRLPQQRRARAEMPLRAHLLLPRVLLGAVSFFIGLYVVMLFEWWAVNLTFSAGAALQAGDSGFVEIVGNRLQLEENNLLHLPRLFQPYETFSVPSPESESDVQRLIGERLPLLSLTLCGTFLLFLCGIMPLRLMSLILPPVWHNDELYRKRLLSAPTYAGQFYLAVLAQNPMFTIASLLVWIFLIAMPLLVDVVGKPMLLQAMVGADQILFAFTLLAAWVSPLVYAGVYVDRTFTTYFNTKLANLILDMRGHLVVFGYGHLGQRVVDRELLKIRRQQAEQPRTRRFEKIVSPELDIEELCPSLIIVDRDLSKLLFSASTDFLGDFGVVAALEEHAGSPAAAHDQTGKPQRGHRHRILAPMVQGDVTEPFTMSRVNFERAGFLISTVSQEERIREVFDRAAGAGLRAIICVSRSDQMVNLTYKATRYPITFVYPKQDSGLALGQRLIAGVLKILPQLPPGRKTPSIMVVGLNKSNHYMLETLWHAWPGDNLKQRAAEFSRMLRFVIRGGESVHPMPRLPQAASDSVNEANDAQQELFLLPRATSAQTFFSWWWRCNFITGFRFPPGPAGRRPLYFPVPTCLMQSNESGILEHCLDEFKPDIVVINDDEVDRSHMYFLKLINSLERLKFERPDFHLPLILMGGAHGGDAEQKDIGDAFHLYDALTRLYQDRPTPGHPRYAHFRRRRPRRLIGDSAHDALADTEEIISGIRDNWQLAAEAPLSVLASESDDERRENDWGESVELNACLSNVPGALPALSGRLAGLEFSSPAQAPLEKIFGHSTGSTPVVLQPVFQYLRHIKLAVAGRGFSLTGYADLHATALTDVLRHAHEPEGLALRVYASDGRDYLKENLSLHARAQLPVPKLISLATGQRPHTVSTQDFLGVMLGANTGDSATGATFCPGMVNCPIASYQHYIIASNAEAIAAWRRNGQNQALQAAPNYGCAPLPTFPLRLSGTPQAEALPRYARIFCCCHAERNDPGMIALALNLLNFQRFERLRNRQNDWVLNVEYFKNISCQNRVFVLNRLFGVRRYISDLLRENEWSLEDYEQRLHRILPLTLLQIMPAGGPEEARLWFDYAVALYRYLWLIAPQRFSLHWWDQDERLHRRHRLRSEAEHPIVIQISNRQHREREQLRAAGCCEFCRASDPALELGCAQQRPWVV